MQRRIGTAILGAIALLLGAGTAAPAEPTPGAADARPPVEAAVTAPDFSLLAATPTLLGRIAGESVAIAVEPQPPRYRPTVRLGIEIVTDWTWVR